MHVQVVHTAKQYRISFLKSSILVSVLLHKSCTLLSHVHGTRLAKEVPVLAFVEGVARHWRAAACTDEALAVEGTCFVNGVLAEDGLNALCTPQAKLLDVALFAIGLVLMVDRRLFHQVLLAVGAIEALVVVRPAAVLDSLLVYLILACNTAYGALARFMLVTLPATNLVILEHKLFASK